MGWTREYFWHVVGMEDEATVTVSHTQVGGAEECQKITVTSEGDYLGTARMQREGGVR